MDKPEEILDLIPEASAARTAYHLAVIPILGFFLYTGLAFLALYQIGKGRTGFFWLGKGFWRMLRMTSAGVVCFAACWFCPFFEYDPETGESGYSIRSFSYPPQHLKMWHWKFSRGTRDPIYEGNYKFGKKDGKWISWYSAKQKEWETEYSAGMENGHYIAWRENGQIYEEGEYKNGEKNGQWKEWSEEGKLIIETSYRNGKKNGKETQWHDNGVKQEEGEYRDEQPIGVWTQWYEHGVKYSENKYSENGNELYSAEWYENGQKKNETIYQKDGRYATYSWYEDGREQQMADYDVVPEGTILRLLVKRYINGQKYFSYERQSKWELWYKNGKKMAEGQRNNNIRWIFWYQNGIKHGEGITSDEIFSAIVNSSIEVRPWSLSNYESSGMLNDNFTMVGWKFWDEDGRPLSSLKTKRIGWDGSQDAEGYVERIPGALNTIIKEGKWTYRDGWGKKTAEGEYCNDRKDGVWTAYADNYVVKKCPYAYDVPNGVEVGYHPNGKKASEGYYTNHGRSGSWTTWYENGQKEIEGKYEKNAKTDTWILWDINGKMLDKRVYKQDRLISRDIFRHSGGNIEFEKTTDDPQYNGTWTIWYENGNKASISMYLDNVRYGIWATWYENGNKWSEGKYVNSAKSGPWTYWYENGNKAYSGEYSKGTKTGVWQYWDESGNQVKEETYNNGMLIDTKNFSVPAEETIKQ